MIYNIYATWIRTSNIKTNGNYRHFFIRVPILGHVLAHSFEKTHVLVAIVKLICLLFLNKLFSKFVPIPNKTLRFTIFRRNYVNHTAVVLNNRCQSYTAFLPYVRCWKWTRSFFCSCLSAMKVLLRNLLMLSTRVARMLWTPRWLGRRKE